MSQETFMEQLQSRVQVQSVQFRENELGMEALLQRLAEEMEKSRSQGPEAALAKATADGKFSARTRLELLLDQDSPFLELLPLAGLGGKGFGPGGTLVGGIGLVSNRLCLVTSNVGTNKGGQSTLQRSGSPCA